MTRAMRIGAGGLWLAVLAGPVTAQQVYSTVPEPPPERASATATVHLRAGPGTGTPVVGRLARGDTVDLVGCDRPAGWCEVAVAPGRRAWVSAAHLVRQGTRVQPAPTHIEIPPPAGPPIVVEVNPYRR